MFLECGVLAYCCESVESVCRHVLGARLTCLFMFVQFRNYLAVVVVTIFFWSAIVLTILAVVVLGSQSVRAEESEPPI